MAIIAPMAQWRPFSGKSSIPLTHDIVCLHTMVGSLAGSWSWASGAGRSYWHFGIGGRGECWQCQELEYRSAANLNGNWHVIPIETADTGEGIFPVPWGNPPWTNAQINRIVELVAWLCARFNIPPVLIPDTKPGRRGIAYHRQGIDGNYPDRRVPGGELWSNADGKICPADPRIHQLKTIVIPRVQSLLKGQVPVPIDDTPTPDQEEEDMKTMRLVQRSSTTATGDRRAAVYLVEGLEKMHINSQTALNEAIWIFNEQLISHDINQWPAHWVDALVPKRPGVDDKLDP